MALHITQQQEGEIRNLVQRRCANYRKGNCLLLDGLEESTCVQLLCSSGIYCRYFQNAVLPREKELYTHILKQNTRRNVHESNKWNLPEANPGNRGYHADVFGCFRWRIKCIRRHFTRKPLSHSVVKR